MTPRSRTFLALALGSLAACSQGPSQADQTTTSQQTALAAFEVVSVNFLPGQPWPLNRRIEITLSEDIDPASLSSNSVKLLGLGDADQTFAGFGQAGPGTSLEPALGSLELISPQTIAFTPACPTGAKAQGAGLKPGRQYRLTLPAGQSGIGIRSVSGSPLVQRFARTLTTPFSGKPADRFDDALPGAPALVVRPAGSTEEDASYLEIGGDPLARVYFEMDSSGATVLPAGFLAPLNTYSESDSAVDFVLRFDQPLEPSAANLARIALEFDDGGIWQPFGAQVELDGGCGTDGVFVRVIPQGILPQGSSLRVRLRAGLSDLVGEATAADLLDLPTPVSTEFDRGTLNPGDHADRLLESFVQSGEDSLEDTQLGSEVRAAVWGQGKLVASNGFPGTGGPGGDFDWYLNPGESVVVSTTSSQIIGGPGGTPTTVQTVLNGVVDVRDLVVPIGSRIIFVGPNPATILISGKAQIDGDITVSGSDSAGVGTLDTTNFPEFGAAGNAGGGNGGVGSFLTTQSTPRGGSGFGAFFVPNAGGEGGESGYSQQGIAARRGAGGGGGRLGPDIDYRWMNNLVPCQALTGMDGEPGFGGGDQGLGAISQSMQAQGGAQATGPFVDGDPDNNFTGRLDLRVGGSIQGELDGPLPGNGGGAGGDASSTSTWPMVPFQATGDEKGSGGGGGAGQLQLIAIGEILVSETGTLRADGGDGGGGENTSFFNRVGGGSGGGSGGSIRLESLAFVEVQGIAQGSEPFYGDSPLNVFHFQRSLSALGGQGGAGNNNKGGARETGPTTWRCDAIPLDRVIPLAVPPAADNCFINQPDFSKPGGPTQGAGGDGGPGLIQISVPDPLANLRFPDADDVTQVSAPPPVGWSDGAFIGFLAPSIGLDSVAQSRWIPLGQAAYDPGGSMTPPSFFVGGLDANGFVKTAGGLQDPGQALVPAAAIVAAPGVPTLGSTPFEIVFDAGSVSGFADAYERNPELLRKGWVRLANPAGGASKDFEIASASYDPSLDRFRVQVSSDGDPLTSFAPAGVTAALHPRDLGLIAADGSATLPPGARVRYRLDATLAGPDGQPDPSQAYSAVQGDFPSDPSALNGTSWDFVRFRVDFLLAPNNPQGPAPALDFVSLPFRF